MSSAEACNPRGRSRAFLGAWSQGVDALLNKFGVVGHRMDACAIKLCTGREHGMTLRRAPETAAVQPTHYRLLFAGTSRPSVVWYTL